MAITIKIVFGLVYVLLQILIEHFRKDMYSFAHGTRVDWVKQMQSAADIVMII